MSIKIIILPHNGAYGIVMRGVQKCTRGCSSLRDRNALSLCCIKLDTATDPFCGSGTILIESALIANHIAPGLHRGFAAQGLPWVKQTVWRQELDRALSDIRRTPDFKATGSDIDPQALRLCERNAMKAGVGSCIRTVQADIRDFTPDDGKGLVITNPPYGERLLDVQAAQQLYRVMGRRFIPQRGWRYYIISPDEQFETLFGKKADKRRKLYNGMIKCQLYMYFKR